MVSTTTRGKNTQGQTTKQEGVWGYLARACLFLIFFLKVWWIHLHDNYTTVCLLLLIRFCLLMHERSHLTNQRFHNNKNFLNFLSVVSHPETSGYYDCLVLSSRSTQYVIKTANHPRQKMAPCGRHTLKVARTRVNEVIVLCVRSDNLNSNHMIWCSDINRTI